MYSLIHSPWPTSLVLTSPPSSLGLGSWNKATSEKCQIWTDQSCMGVRNMLQFGCVDCSGCDTLDLHGCHLTLQICVAKLAHVYCGRRFFMDQVYVNTVWICSIYKEASAKLKNKNWGRPGNETTQAEAPLVYLCTKIWTKHEQKKNRRHLPWSGE